MDDSQTSEQVALEIRRHCSGCPECQSDYGCAVYSRLKAKHYRIASAEGDMATVREYDRQDRELQEELEYYRSRAQI